VDAQYDSIILGSGISGLTAACLLAKVRKEKVLVLEQHNIVGGFTHTFRRGKFEWDTGLHYVGNMGESDFPRKVMDFVTEGRVSWLKMPEPFELFHFPHFKFGQRSGEKRFIEDLCAQFPGEREVIEKYFKELLRAQIWGTLKFASQILPPFLGWIPRLAAVSLRRYGNRSLGEYFAEHVKNADLAAVLAGPCGDHGLAPSEASFFIHALIVRHYLNGGYYPEGGSGRLPAALKTHLQKLGVEILTRHQAEEILVEKGRVKGVRALNGGTEKVFRARSVVSTVGLRQTYGRLLGGKAAREIQNFRKGMTIATIYLGLKESPAKFGFNGENHWLFSTTDFEAMHAQEKAPAGEVQGCYISFPSLKDKSAQHHTAEIMVPANFDYFLNFSRGGWRRRGADYEERKKELAAAVLEYVERKFPGFKEIIEFTEVSTPLSIDHFTKHAHGECYGLPATTGKYRLKGLGPRTHIKGLYLAGADVLAHGIVGAMMSGLCAVTASGGPLGVIKVFKAIANKPV
jgi:phytoene dehydrogenase-like protein